MAAPKRVVSWLSEALVELGHQVTLFASGDSVTRASLVSVWPGALRLSKPRVDPVIAQTDSLQHVADRASEFDVIHFHTDWTHLPLLERLGVPFVTTMHGRLDLPGLTELVRRFPNAALVSISESQRHPLPGGELGRYGLSRYAAGSATTREWIWRLSFLPRPVSPERELMRQPLTARDPRLREAGSGPLSGPPFASRFPPACRGSDPN